MDDKSPCTVASADAPNMLCQGDTIDSIMTVMLSLHAFVVVYVGGMFMSKILNSLLVHHAHFQRQICSLCLL